jgi:hypothetical protein
MSLKKMKSVNKNSSLIQQIQKMKYTKDNIIARDSYGIEINKDDIIHINIKFLSTRDFVGRFLSLNLDKTDGNSFGTYFIESFDDDEGLIDIDVELNNDFTPLDDIYCKITITNLSYEQEKQNLFSPNQN